MNNAERLRRLVAILPRLNESQTAPHRPVAFLAYTSKDIDTLVLVLQVESWEKFLNFNLGLWSDWLDQINAEFNYRLRIMNAENVWLEPNVTQSRGIYNIHVKEY